MKQNYNPRQKSWDTKQGFPPTPPPPPTYNVDNHAILFLFLFTNATFSNIDEGCWGGGGGVGE